jgi:hypothetical protein
MLLSARVVITAESRSFWGTTITPVQWLGEDIGGVCFGGDAQYGLVAGMYLLWDVVLGAGMFGMRIPIVIPHYARCGVAVAQNVRQSGGKEV